jgi:surfactin synthase thioesterase subunit
MEEAGITLRAVLLAQPYQDGKAKVYRPWRKDKDQSWLEAGDTALLSVDAPCREWETRSQMDASPQFGAPFPEC